MFTSRLTVQPLRRNLINFTSGISRNMTSSSHGNQHQKDFKSFKTLEITNPKEFVFHVELNRPNKLNAFNKQMWIEIKDCFESLSTNPDCRAVVLSAAGRLFTAGIDLNDMMIIGQELSNVDDVGRKGKLLEHLIKLYQDSMSSLELCPKPIITAVHSACIGAGLNLITAADIRYCSEDAWFTVKEVDIGMPADVGVLQRLPKVIGNQSLAREICYTARKVTSKEAIDCGLVNKIFDTKDACLNGALQLAEEIASKSPLAVQATKKSMVYSLDHTNQEGLDHIREINKLLLQSEDFFSAMSGQLTKSDKPIFSKL